MTRENAPNCPSIPKLELLSSNSNPTILKTVADPMSIVISLTCRPFQALNRLYCTDPRALEERNWMQVNNVISGE